MRHALFCCLLILSSFSSSVKGQFRKFQDDTPEVIKDSASVTRDWEKLESMLKNLVNNGIKMLLPILMDNMQDVNISSKCVRQAMQIVGGIQKLKPWAVRFVDSSAKSLDGLMTGSIFSFGAYDECVDTVVIDQRPRKNHKAEVMFTGKYCILRIKPPLPPRKPFYKFDEVMDELQGIYKKGTVLSKAAKYAHFLYEFSVRLGLCIPSGCSVDDINQVFAKVANGTNLYMKVKRCEVKEEPRFTLIMIIVMFLYSLAGFMVLLGTLIDINYYYFARTSPTSTSIRVLLAFSFVSNFRRFVDTSTSSKSLSCLHGIRFLTMSWITLSHSYILSIYQVVSGLEYVRHMAQDFALQVVMNGFLAVDTFFFLGGFLVCYVTTKFVKIHKRDFSIKRFILHRLWRILPVYSFVILYVFIGEISTSGPIAHGTIQPFIEGCKENWWTNLLFINNYYRVNDMCLPYTFYISLDMQFYVGSLIILLPLFRWPKVGISIAVISIVVSMVVSASVSYVKNFPPTLILSNPSLEQIATFMTEFYFKPYPHCGPYVVGIITGYILAMNQNLKIPKVIQYLGWICSVVFSMLVVYGTYEWNLGHEPTFWETALYSGCHRVAWTLSVAWMVICCATGYGGVVNYILSWKAWIPLGRLTFISYLVHPLVQAGLVTVFRGQVHPKHSIGVWFFFGHLMATCGVAFAGSMLVESPCLSLEKLVLLRRHQNTSNKNEKESNHALDAMQVIKENDPELLNHNSVMPQTRDGVENSAYVCSRL